MRGGAALCSEIPVQEGLLMKPERAAKIENPQDGAIFGLLWKRTMETAASFKHADPTCRPVSTTPA